MIKLTAVIITFNEEKNIRRCLESILDIVDEIVVVDSFSDDATELICMKYGARFIRRPFDGHIEQKNFAVSQATHDHILSLDADEVLSESLRKSISKVKENWQYDGYSFKRLTSYCGKWIRHTSWYPSRKLRLWDRRKGEFGGRNPHDRIILHEGATHNVLKGHLLHYSYNSIIEHISQINYFSTIIAREYYKERIRITRFEILYHAFWRFFRDYFIKLGFLDGLYGLIISVNSSFETYLKYSKLKIMMLEKSVVEKSRICFVNSMRSWGGGEKWHFDVSRGLYTKGYDILLVSSSGSELNKRALINNIPVLTICISNLSFINPVKIFQVYRMLKKEKIRTLIINQSKDLKLFGIAGKLARLKHIIYRRGSALPIRNTVLNRFLFRKIITDIIANSKETRRTIFQNNTDLVQAEKIRIIYNGIDLKTFDGQVADTIYSRFGKEILIGNAGRLSEEKGQILLIDLARRLKSHGNNFRILIAGEGKLQSKLKNYARMQGVEEIVIFMGFIENVKSFYSTIDIFVLTSVYEGFGYVLVEAMAAQKPVVSFDISSSAEIIENGISGFLVPGGDIEHLAEKLELLMKDADLRKKMGSKGRERVEEVFTLERTLDEVEELIKDKEFF